MVSKDSTTQEKIKNRAVILGVILAVLFSAVNGYLSINIGSNFSYGAIAVILAYSLFHKLGGGSSKKELSFVLISSASSLGLYNSIALIIYLLQTDPELSLPYWMAPPREAITQRSLDPRFWVIPIAFLIFMVIMTRIIGLVFTYVLREEFIRSERMVWPYQAANSSLVDACIEGGGSARLVAISALVGFTVTFLQNIPSIWGVDLTVLDLSHYLPRGALLVISLNLGFMALGYLMSFRTSASIMVTGLITYLLVSPYLVSIGYVEGSPDIMEMYNELLFRFSIGPALGFLLLGGVILSVVMLLRNYLSKKTEDQGADESLSYPQLYKALIRGLLTNRGCLLIVLGVTTILFGMVWFLNPFQPLPRIVSLMMFLYLFLVGGFVEFVVICKMAGETGMSMGITSIFLYDIPLFGLGYRGFPGYWSYPYFRPSPHVANGILPYLKYEDRFHLSWREILKAKLVVWLPTILFSVAFTLVLWKYIGFGTPIMPAASLIQGKVYLTMMATGDFVGTTSGIFPAAFVISGVLGAILEVFTPLSMMGLGMGMILPPHYILIMGIGGLVRLYTDRRFGKDFYNDKGRLIVTGLMASSLIVQVTMTILTNFLS
ncbi:hypothetical protein E2P65_03480 [Candidatus Bathyarchaeota archaeon]|nr:hypothetical protein E2P65_03480 [Candidatus Bathyarchaeota archaeon]